MSDGDAQKARADIMQIWRDWLTESERQWNTFWNEVMGTEGFARALGGWMELYSVFQRTLAQAVERYLTAFNVPTRSDVLGLGEELRAIEGRLTGLEEKLAALLQREGVEAEAPAPSPAPAPARPRRTRRPARAG